MPHLTLQAGAPGLPLKPGMRLKLEARSATTDTEVAGVTSTRWSIYGYDASEGPPLSSEVPRWTPTSVQGTG